MIQMDKDKIEILSGFIDRTIESAKVIADPNTSIGDKVLERHKQGMNIKGAIFQMNQLKNKKMNSDLKIGGVVHQCDSFDLVVPNRQYDRVDVSPKGNPTVTIEVKDFGKDLCEKIREAMIK
jgi:hypothetical protein